MKQKHYGLWAIAIGVIFIVSKCNSDVHEGTQHMYQEINNAFTP